MFIDFVFISLLIMAIFKGYTKGLVVALFSFIAIIIGLVAATKLSAVTANWLHKNTQIGMYWLPILSFALVMFAAVLLVKFTAKMVEKSIQFAMLGWINKLAGIVLYCILYTTIFSVLLFFAIKINFISPQTLASSKTYFFIQPFGPKAIDGFGVVIPIFKNLFQQLETFFSAVNNKLT